MDKKRFLIFFQTDIFTPFFVSLVGYNNKEIIMEWVGGKDINDLFFDPALVTSMPKFRLIHHKFLASNESDESSFQGESSYSFRITSLQITLFILLFPKNTNSQGYKL